MLSKVALVVVKDNTPSESIETSVKASESYPPWVEGRIYQSMVPSQFSKSLSAPMSTVALDPQGSTELLAYTINDATLRQLPEGQFGTDTHPGSEQGEQEHG